MVIFYSYVSLPEGKQPAMSRDTVSIYRKFCVFFRKKRRSVRHVKKLVGLNSNNDPCRMSVHPPVERRMPQLSLPACCDVVGVRAYKYIYSICTGWMDFRVLPKQWCSTRATCKWTIVRYCRVAALLVVRKIITSSVGPLTYLVVQVQPPSIALGIFPYKVYKSLLFPIT
jgi:hypothetical protein